MKSLGIVLGLLMALGSVSVLATELKIGFISLDKLLKESVPAQRAMKKLEKEFTPRAQEVEKMVKQAKDLQTQLEKEGLTMGESEHRAKEQDLARMNRDIKRVQRELNEDLNLRKNEELAQVLERANKVIGQIGEAEKFDLILQDGVYHSPRIDITDKVLKALTDK